MKCYKRVQTYYKTVQYNYYPKMVALVEEVKTRKYVGGGVFRYTPEEIQKFFIWVFCIPFWVYLSMLVIGLDGKNSVLK